ncbi:hypothetical protein GCM10007898_26750 [Dyella flagellata]|uniref:Peptide N-acetyl-beta-D-glucosaminyl asparaginase amidase A N-terminal domain-containing protein n=2 Tax=Dyella flagellata TaxID=1867833 RepID=A0ABQ5XBT4_9GAMM|nr:hypothetical protein GCM10007898_26750 [Dyella flagellata]
MPLARRLAATAPFIVTFVFCSIEPVSAGTIASIDPHVPGAVGQPCVVELLHNRNWPQQFVDLPVDPTVTYTPPAACPPPWSKVILKLHVQANRRSVVDSLGMDLANVRLFHGAVPLFNGASNWTIERDLTDYSALFKAPQTGLIWSAQQGEANDNVDSFAFQGSASLTFYRSSAATPAPKVPDAVIPVNEVGPLDLPHNIVRAYLDVESDYVYGLPDPDGDSSPLWYTCFSNDANPFYTFLTNPFAPGSSPDVHIFPPNQGCNGGNFQELQVNVDNTPAGIAPAFPDVIADLNWIIPNSADQPITTLEMLNFKPYRVDLTPFAGVLSAPGSHSISISTLATDTNGAGGATLLAYLDPNSSQVSGAVTLNTLATGNGAPTDVDTIHQTSSDSIEGTITTQQHRDFEIRGFVSSSQGIVNSRVHQTSNFNSTQFFDVIAPPLPLNVPVNQYYHQTVWMNNTVQEVSSRTIGSTLLSWDRINVQYPLQWAYADTVQSDNLGDTEGDSLLHSNVRVTQGRVIDSDHYLPGKGHFITHLTSGFQSARAEGTNPPNPLWESSTTRDYSDNFGSCYHGSMQSANGVITSHILGAGCPNNHNWVIWFAHPDGSPDGLDW